MLTDSQKDILTRAAELIEIGETNYSCSAIARAARELAQSHLNTLLCEAYCEFYDKPFGEYWLGMSYDTPNEERAELKKLRVLMLLTFAEVG